MPNAVAFEPVLTRSFLLERLHRLRPHLISLVAPAGFGKSTLTRQFLEGQEAVAVCECAHVADDLDLIRRILSSLAQEQPDRQEALAQRALIAGDPAMTSAERIALMLNAWRTSACPSTFVFEDAEHAVTSSGTRDLLKRLLAERPQDRTIVLCSRDQLPIHLSRYVPPHRIVTLRAEDLAFTRDELKVLLEPLSLDRQSVDRIFEISGGWPIPALFLARLASEGRDDRLLARLGDVAFEELHEYLVDQVLDALPASIVSPLFAAACIPNATDTEIALATGDAGAGSALADLERRSPFVRRGAEGTFIVHPLMQEVLIDKARDRRATLLRTTAQAFDGAGDHIRAAELHMAREDQEAVAESLECIPAGDYRVPPMRYSTLVSALDRGLVSSYPTLWTYVGLTQMFCADSEGILAQVESLWAMLSADTPLHKKLYLSSIRVLLLTYLGRFGQAQKVTDALIADVMPATPTAREQGYPLYLQGTVFARQGRVEDAETALTEAWPLVEGMDLMASSILMMRAVEIERPRGALAEERALLAQSLEYTRRSKFPNFVASRLAEVVFGAWLSGDDVSFAQGGMELEDLVEAEGIRALRYFTDCVRGRLDVEPSRVDMARYVLYAHLIASCTVTERERALRHAEEARKVAERYPNPFLQLLAAVSAAELSDADGRPRWYAEALTYARALGIPRLIDAVTAAEAQNDAGMLRTFIARLKAGRPAPVARLEISMVDGSVRSHGQGVRLADRELAVLMLLARRPGTVSRGQITAALWPDREEELGSNSLKVHLHNLRSKLGDEGAILRTREGLRLCEDVSVDLWEIDRAVGRLREVADDTDRDLVAGLYDRIHCERPARMLEWEWFEPIERHICELRCELAGRLARYALASGKPDRALALSGEIIAYDPCEESATEIAISAYIKMGDRAGALRQFRRYRSVLAAELGCEPSPSVAKLLETKDGS